MSDTPPLLLLTRPQEASQKLVRTLKARGLIFEPVISPLIGIDYCVPLPAFAPETRMIFTSAHGVKAYHLAGGAADLIAYTVGSATDLAARKAGFDTRCAFGAAKDLVKLITAEAPDVPLLHIRGEHARGDIAQTLQMLGFAADEAILYKQPALPITNAAQAILSGSKPVIAPLYSPRTAQILAQHPVKAPLSVAALSEAVAKACAPLHKTELRITARPESEQMLSLLADMIETAHRD